MATSENTGRVSLLAYEAETVPTADRRVIAVSAWNHGANSLSMRLLLTLEEAEELFHELTEALTRARLTAKARQRLD